MIVSHQARAMRRFSMATWLGKGIVLVLAAVAVGAFFMLGVAGESSRAATGSAGIVSSMSLAGMAAVVLRQAWGAFHK